MGFHDSSYIILSQVQNSLTLQGFADNVWHMKISKNRRGKHAAEFWTHVGDTFSVVISSEPVSQLTGW